MVFYLALFLLLWSMIFSIANFFRYYKIVKEYKDKGTAKVISVRVHPPRNKKEKKAMDVTLEYCIDEKVGQTEIVVPASETERFALGTEVSICYKVEQNGAVHLASDSSANKKMMRGHILAFILELVAFVIIWLFML